MNAPEPIQVEKYLKYMLLFTIVIIINLKFITFFNNDFTKNVFLNNYGSIQRFATLAKFSDILFKFERDRQI